MQGGRRNAYDVTAAQVIEWFIVWLKENAISRRIETSSRKALRWSCWLTQCGLATLFFVQGQAKTSGSGGAEDKWRDWSPENQGFSSRSNGLAPIRYVLSSLCGA